MNDFKFALRQLARSPGFTFIAILTLALGIGANSAIVTLIDTLAFRSIKAHRPEELASLFQHDVANPKNFDFFSYADYMDLRQDRTVFRDLAAYNMASVGVRDGDLLRSVTALLVSPNYFATLGVNPILGRVFLEEEERLGASSVVLTHAYWQKIGGAPDIVGKPLRTAMGDLTVVGVMPEGFTGSDPSSCAFFVPVGAAQILWAQPGKSVRTLEDRGERSFMLFGRLTAGINLQKADKGLELLSQKFPIANPKDAKARRLVATDLQRFVFSNRPSNFAKRVAPLATLALVLSVVVLAVACLNIANMLLARGAARRKEVAVRLAIGASRWRVLRQLLAEGFLLAAIGAVAGLVLSTWCTTALANILNSSVGFDLFKIDLLPSGRILFALLALCGLATLFFALGPAWRLASLDVNSDLKQHGAAEAMDRTGRFNLKTLLVGGQLALSLALLAAASLFTRSAIEAMRADPGFAMNPLLIARIDTGLLSYPEGRAREIFDQAEERLAALPGIEAVSSAMFVPFGQESSTRDVQLGGAPRPSEGAKSVAEGRPLHARVNVAGADYFRTLGLPLLRGREFNRLETTSKTAPPVAIITRGLAEELFPGQDPIGRTIQFPAHNEQSQPQLMEVVGVAPMIVWELFEKDYREMVITPRGRDFQSSMRLHIRVLPNTDPASMSDLVRKTLREIDPQMPLTEIQTLMHMHTESASVKITRIGAMLFGSFGGIALLLSFIGVYGLKAYSVARRAREIGIRMALGATGRDVVKMIITEGSMVTLGGLLIGAVLAAVVGKMAGKYLYGISGLDPVTFTLIPATLALVALVACWLPARRATKVNPIQALRCE